MMSELFDEEVLRKQYSIAERRMAFNEGEAVGIAKAIKAMKGMTYEEFLKFTQESEDSLPN